MNERAERALPLDLFLVLFQRCNQGVKKGNDQVLFTGELPRVEPYSKDRAFAVFRFFVERLFDLTKETRLPLPPLPVHAYRERAGGFHAADHLDQPFTVLPVANPVLVRIVIRNNHHSRVLTLSHEAYTFSVT